MERETDIGVYILASGKQTRYENPQSKLLADVHGKPAFSYLMNTLLAIFPEENISIASSNLFSDFNNWVNDTYPRANFLIGDEAGTGTANTLKKSFPWGIEPNFVTEADIYYDIDLVRGLIKVWNNSPKAKACIGVSPLVHVAPTHRQIEINPNLIIYSHNDDDVKTQEYRNIGAYILSGDVENYIRDDTQNIVDVIGLMILGGEIVVPYIYSEILLHIAELRDVEKWREYFSNSSVNP